MRACDRRARLRAEARGRRRLIPRFTRRSEVSERHVERSIQVPDNGRPTTTARGARQTDEDFYDSGRTCRRHVASPGATRVGRLPSALSGRLTRLHHEDIPVAIARCSASSRGQGSEGWVAG